MGRKREMSQWLLEDVSPRLRQCGDVIERRMENGRKATAYPETGLRIQVAAVARQVQKGKTGLGGGVTKEGASQGTDTTWHQQSLPSDVPVTRSSFYFILFFTRESRNPALLWETS